MNPSSAAVNMGLLRSILIYYGQPHKLLRMVAFYRQFIRPGDLCFDVGAHVGNRIWAWLRLGARIVAVEPQRACVQLLRRFYGRKSEIALVEAAVGAAQGKQKLYVSQRNLTVSSLSSSWIAAVKQHPAFSSVRWDVKQEVEVITLNALIHQFGEPEFCKIDVEGFELEVLQGLSRPLPALSFEYLPITRALAFACIEHLCRLGDYKYNWSERETHQLVSTDWLSPSDMCAVLRETRAGERQGDIFARLILD